MSSSAEGALGLAVYAGISETATCGAIARPAWDDAGRRPTARRARRAVMKVHERAGHATVEIYEVPIDIE